MGLTRAMDRIFITNAELRRSYMGPEYKQPSRFIDEIPREFINIKSYNSQGYGGENNYREQYRNAEIKTFNTDRSSFAEQQKTKDSYSDSIPERRSENDESGSKFMLKESVMHPKFGVGRIISIEGTGDNIKLTISFGLTKRVFMEKYTPLQKLN